MAIFSSFFDGNTAVKNLFTSMLYLSNFPNQTKFLPVRGKFSSQKMSYFLLSGLNRPSTLTEINEKSAIPIALIFELSPFFAAGSVA